MMKVFSNSRLKEHKFLSRPIFLGRNRSLEVDSLENRNTYQNPIASSQHADVNPLTFPLPIDCSVITVELAREYNGQQTSLTIEKQLSFRSEPSWKRSCFKAVRMIGPIAAQIFQVELGIPQEKSMDLYCHTEECSRFVKTYSVMILASLQAVFSRTPRKGRKEGGSLEKGVLLDQEIRHKIEEWCRAKDVLLYLYQN